MARVKGDVEANAIYFGEYISADMPIGNENQTKPVALSPTAENCSKQFLSVITFGVQSKRLYSN